MRKGQSRAVMPTPEQWAQEKLKHAPARSGEWARRVARIYCLDISDDQEGAVTPEDRDAIRRAGARDSRASRAAAGLPEHIEDPAAAAQLAGLMRGTPRPGAQRPAKPRTGTLGGSPACCRHARSPRYWPSPSVPSAANGGNGDYRRTGSASTPGGKNATCTPGSTARPHDRPPGSRRLRRVRPGP